MKTTCDTCGAPLEPDGYCAHDLPARYEMAVRVWATQKKERINTKVFDRIPARVALIIFVIAVIYSIGGGFDLYHIPVVFDFAQYLTRFVTASYIFVSAEAKNDTYLTILWGFNAAISIIVAIMIAGSLLSA